MSLGKAILCILCPPLAVLDKGCGTTLLVGVLWLCMWIPGSIAAWIINSRQPQQVIIYQQPPNDTPPPQYPPKPKPSPICLR